MSTSAIASSPGAASQVNNINLQDFLQILSTQLTNQDPLKPLDDQEFLAQIAQFSTLEQSTQLNASINQMLSVQSVTQSVGLIGKNITYNPTNGGQPVSGTVTALNYVSGAVQLTVSTPVAGSTTPTSQSGITLSQVSSVQ
jgi:flagellar basal-body rod modification protein FlgD